MTSSMSSLIIGRIEANNTKVKPQRQKLEDAHSSLNKEI